MNIIENIISRVDYSFTLMMQPVTLISMVGKKNYVSNWSTCRVGCSLVAYMHEIFVLM